ncbi:MAG: outer membrane protein assembly factor BamC [Betaproteobacteria bacterium]|nr:outer membrane protein assembly factor BamC [Betaproteobacteria bacterium]
MTTPAAFARIVLVAVIAAGLAACGAGNLLDVKGVEYKSAGRLPPLEIPPDLTSPTRDDRYQVPEANRPGSATFSTYNAERAGQPRQGTPDVLPAVSKVRMERSGTQRWLVVPETPEKLWPVVKEFWQELGFLIKIELPEAGVMETDWAENRAKIPQDFVRNLLGKVMDQAFSTSERDKFRTRLERGSEPGTTEIYVSHRGVMEVFTNTQKDSTVWQPRASDLELEAEFLHRLMVRFGVDETRAKAQLAGGETRIDRAKIINTQTGGGLLELSEPFDRAWRRVGLALDRVGFTVEDRDRSKGYYFVRYVDPQTDAKDTNKKDDGMLSRLLFWRSNKTELKAEQYRVQVKDANNESTQVQVLAKDGAADQTATAKRILSLLHDQLK